jgi:hypothetical protein
VSHFGSDLVERPGQEVGGAHPGLEGSERVLDGLPAHEHSIGHPVKPGLHRVEEVFMFPALDPLQLVWGTSGLEGTGEAGGQMAVIVDVLPAIRSGASLVKC